MQIAILTFSIIGAATGTASLLIMAKTAKELKHAKDEVESNVETFKAKTDRNIKRIKSVLSEMEL